MRFLNHNIEHSYILQYFLKAQIILAKSQSQTYPKEDVDSVKVILEVHLVFIEK
jgi:hypothetical protein